MGFGDHLGGLGDKANEFKEQHGDRINQGVDDLQEQHGDRLGQHREAIDGAQENFLGDGQGGEDAGGNPEDQQQQ